jgi:hypothetical protein
LTYKTSHANLLSVSYLTSAWNPKEFLAVRKQYSEKSYMSENMRIFTGMCAGVATGVATHSLFVGIFTDLAIWGALFCIVKAIEKNKITH